MPILGMEGLYGVLHKDGEALIWPTLDCSLPVLNQRNQQWAKAVGEPITVPEGWNLEYFSEDKLDPSRYSKWVFVININAQKTWILRSTFELDTDEMKALSQFSDEGVKSCLARIPQVILDGDGMIYLEDCLEWVMATQRDMINRCCIEVGIDLHRIMYLDGVNLYRYDSVWFDAFESQTIYDVYGNGGTLADYETPDRNPTKKFICLNRRCDAHRLMVYNELVQQHVIDEGYFTYTHQDADIFLRDNPMLDMYLDEHEYKLEDMLELPEMSIAGEDFRQSDGWPRNGFTDTIQKAFNDSRYYIITETHAWRWDKFLFPTEKTYRAFLYQIPFIVIGNPGLLEYLTNQGYDVDFDSVGLNYNRSDQTYDKHFMLGTLTSAVSKVNFDTLEVSEADQQRCKNNFEHFKKRALARGWEQTLNLITCV